jgi:hypothetical protein
MMLPSPDGYLQLQSGFVCLTPLCVTAQFLILYYPPVCDTPQGRPVHCRSRPTPIGLVPYTIPITTLLKMDTNCTTLSLIPNS